MDPRELPESDFWRQWNAQAANQWNARAQGLPETAPDFGQFSRDYSQAQQIAALPFKDRQTALMNQESMAQNAFQNRMAQRQEGRLMQGQQFNQELAQERLKMSQEAAMRKQDPYKEAADQMQIMERGLGANPLELLGFAERMPDWQKTGMIRLPGRWMRDPMTGEEKQLPGRDVPFDQNLFNQIGMLRSRLIPGYAHQGEPAQEPMAQPASSGLSPEEMARLAAYQQRLRGEAKGRDFAPADQETRDRLLQFITR